MAASLAARFYSPLTLNVVNYSVNSSNCCLCSVRHYAKRLRRSAQRVLTPTDEQQLLRKRSGDSDPRKNAYVPFVKDDPVQRSRTEWNSQAPPVVTPNIYTKQKPSVNETTLLNTSKVGKDDIRYEKIAEGDKRFGQVILRAKSRKERDKHNITLLEGFRLIRDAINSGADIKCVYFTDLDFIEGLQLDSLEVPLYKVQYRHLKIWTETQSPSGIMGDMIAASWRDKKVVNFISTADGTDNLMTTVPRKKRDGTIHQVPGPSVVSNYNKNMNGVDRADQLRTELATYRTSRRWWQYLFWFIFDVAICNGLVLMRESANHQLTTRNNTKKQRTMVQFRIALAKQLIGQYCGSRKRKRLDNEDEAGKRHWPVVVDKRKRCRSCTKKNIRKDVLTICTGCGIGLCIPCFVPYHEQLML